MSGFVFLIAVLAVALLLYAVVSGGAGKRRRGRRSGRGGGYTSHPRLTPGEFRDRWQTLMVSSRSGAAGLKNALNEADKLFDLALRQSGLSGETMGERLKNARQRFSNDREAYDAVWRAHKLRNALAHEVGFDLVPSQAHGALQDFESGLKILGVL